jgi:hypothetical protein
MYNDDAINFENDDVISYANTEEYNKMVEKMKRSDKGYNVLWRTRENERGRLKRCKIEVYASGNTGTNIRDAETGFYYPHKVGSKDEDLYFKVCLATGECKSKNGSNTLFFYSPEQYTSCLGYEVEQQLARMCFKKHELRFKECEDRPIKTSSYIIVK